MDIVNFKYFVATIGYWYYNFLCDGLVLGTYYRFLIKAPKQITGGIIKVAFKLVLVQCK